MNALTFKSKLVQSDFFIQSDLWWPINSQATRISIISWHSLLVTKYYNLEELSAR